MFLMFLMLYFLVFNTSARLIYSTIETYEEIASNAGDHEVIPLGPSRVRWDFQFRHRTRSFRSTGRLRLWILEPQRCPAPHSEAAAINMASLPYASEYRKLLESFDHRDGKDLIGKKHLSDEEGWKLPSKYIPYRNFSSSIPCPILVTEYKPGVVDWDTWYSWRNLSKESPAALLMSYPMSVYHRIIVNCLELTSPNTGQL